jgi:hypothetical protein
MEHHHPKKQQDYPKTKVTKAVSVPTRLLWMKIAPVMPLWR